MADAGTAPALSADPRFFARSGPFLLSAVIAAIGGDAALRAPADGGCAVTDDATIQGVAPLQTATSDHVSFLDNRRYLLLLAATAAGAVVIHPDLADRVPPRSAAIVTREPYLGWARAATLFHPRPPSRPGRHPTAIIDPSASIDPSAEIGPYCIVGARVEIGAGSALGAFTVVGDGVVIGADARIGPHCCISHAILGTRVALLAGAKIGQEGFGFATSKSGFVSVPQLGRVLIEDDVEIGANTTIDRGSGNDTVIGAGSRLDNLVQIGHNVRLGRCCVIVSQVGISGSTIVGDFVQMAGQAGIAGHLQIGQGARIGGQAGIMADVPAGETVLGSPGQPVREFFRQVALLKKLSAKTIRERGGSAGAPAGETGSG